MPTKRANYLQLLPLRALLGFSNMAHPLKKYRWFLFQKEPLSNSQGNEARRAENE